MIPTFTTEDIDNNKIKAGLGYFVFFLPWILCRDSKLGRFCANQGLLLWIASILLSLLLGFFTALPLIGWAFRLVSRLVRFALFLVALLAFLQLTTHDRPVEIPFIGGFRIFK